MNVIVVLFMAKWVYIMCERWRNNKCEVVMCANIVHMIYLMVENACGEFVLEVAMAL